nr:hypothetical protein [Tanacetum cinerariifolium]
DEVDVNVSTSEKVEQSVKVAEKEISTADPVTTTEINAAKPKAITTAVADSSQQPSKTKEKGKAKMIDSEKPLKRKDQVMIDEEVAKNLEAQMQAELEEEERLARKKKKKPT